MTKKPPEPKSDFSKFGKEQKPNHSMEQVSPGNPSKALSGIIEPRFLIAKLFEEV